MNNPLPPITSFQGHHGFLSNFYPSPIVYKGATYPTVEHAFQSQKSASPITQAYIQSSPSPGIAKRRGREVSPLRADWDQIKVELMKELLVLKFTDPGLGSLLLSTGTRDLIEGNNWGDYYWGVCSGRGRNMLGVLLMEVRDEIRYRF